MNVWEVYGTKRKQEENMRFIESCLKKNKKIQKIPVPQSKSSTLKGGKVFSLQLERTTENFLSIMSGKPLTSSEISLEQSERHEREFSKDFRGPVPDSERNCTDFAFSVFFAMFWIGMLVLGVFALRESSSIGGYERMVNGAQADGKICGQDGAFGAGKEYKYLFTYPSTEAFTNAVKKERGNIPWSAFASLPTSSICVKECPTKRGAVVSGRLENNAGETVDVEMPSWIDTISSEYHSRCIPDAIAMANATSTGAKALHYGRETFIDLTEAGSAIAAAFGFSLLYSSIFLVLMYYFAGVTVLLAIVFGMAALAVSGYFFYFLATCTSKDQDVFSSCGDYDEGSTFKTTFWIGAGMCWGLLVIFTIMVFFMRKRILLAIKLVKQATVAIRDMKQMLLLPLAKIALVAIVIVWWMFVTTALGSAGSIQETGNATFPTQMDDCTAQQIAELKFCSGGDSAKCCEFEQGPTKEVKWNETMYGLFFYHFFGLLWTAAFILAAMNFTLSSATATWYFAESENGELNLDSPVKTGLCRAFGKHGGTLAFGSFLVATLEMIRMIVDYMAKKANKEAKESGSKLVQCVVGCITCIAMW